MAQKRNEPRQPLFHVIKHEEDSRRRVYLIRLCSVLAALLCNALFILLVIGLNPLTAFITMLQGAFGNSIYIWSTVDATVKLLCISVALGLAFKMRFWNCGGEGQVLVGALATAFVMIKLGNQVPPLVLFLCMFLAAAAAGAVWAILPAFCKAKWGTNETLFTLMMNYVAIQIVTYAYNVWRGTKSSLGQLQLVTHAGWFPEIAGHRSFINLLFAVLFVVVIYFYMSRSKSGYEISVVGESQNTARYAGINVTRVIIRTMAISGMICGICGFLTVAGNDQTVSANSASGYGFTAIIVAWLSKFNTFVMAGVALFIVFLEKGTALLSDNYDKFSDSSSAIVTGIFLFFVIGGEFFLHYRVVFGKRTASAQEAGKEVVK